MAQTTSRADLGAFKNRDLYAGNAARKADPKMKIPYWYVHARVDTRWRQLPPLILAIRQRASPKTAKRLSKFWQRMISFKDPISNLAQGSSCENVNEDPFMLDKKPLTMFPAASTEPVVIVVPRKREAKELEGTDNSGASLCPAQVKKEKLHEKGKELSDELPPSLNSQVSGNMPPITGEIGWQRVTWNAQDHCLRIIFAICTLPVLLLIAIVYALIFS